MEELPPSVRRGVLLWFCSNVASARLIPVGVQILATACFTALVVQELYAKYVSSSGESEGPKVQRDSNISNIKARGPGNLLTPQAPDPKILILNPKP